MKEIKKIIKDWCINNGFKTISDAAKRAYTLDYSIWNEPKYDELSNSNFEDLKARREKSIKTRQNILELYETINHHNDIKEFTDTEAKTLYEAFLCTMVWGKIGLNGSSINCFKSVFDINKKESITNSLKEIYVLLCNIKESEEDRIMRAFNTLKSGQKHIWGVGPAFFTKFLYFASNNIGFEVKPMIYDSVMLRTHRAILFSKGETKKALNLENAQKNYTAKNYIEYIHLMKELSKELNPESPLELGHLEALLFWDEKNEKNNGISCRKTIKDYVNNHLKQYINNSVDQEKSGKNKQTELNKKPKNIISENFWKKLQDKIKCSLIGKNKGYKKVDKKFSGNIKLLVQVYQKGYDKNGYQSFGIHNINENQRADLEKKVEGLIIDAKIDLGKTIIIRNMNPEYADDDKKIEWFAGNIQNIISVIG